MGPRTILIVREFIWYNCSVVCGLSPQQLCGGVNGDVLQEGLCHTQDCCTQSPSPCGRPLLTWTSTGDTQTLKGRSGSVYVESPSELKVLFKTSECLAGMGFDSKCDFTPPTVLPRDSPLPWTGGYLFLVGPNVLLLMVVQQQV